MNQTDVSAQAGAFVRYDVHMEATTYLKIKVTPGARTESFEDKGNGRFCISVREKAEDNKATLRVLSLVAQYLGVPPAKLRIRTGHRARNKLIEVLE